MFFDSNKVVISFHFKGYIIKEKVHGIFLFVEHYKENQNSFIYEDVMSSARSVLLLLGVCVSHLSGLHL